MTTLTTFSLDFSLIPRHLTTMQGGEMSGDETIHTYRTTLLLIFILQAMISTLLLEILSHFKGRYDPANTYTPHPDAH